MVLTRTILYDIIIIERRENMTLGEKIKEIRKENTLTQKAFAERLGISRDVIKNAELERCTISELLIRNICYEFGINYEWLTTGAGEKYTDNNILFTLKSKYNLTNLEFKILQGYLNLDMSQRKAVEDFLHEIMDPEPPAEAESELMTVAARGNAEKQIIRDDEAMRADLRNYKPPTDL